jgi:hypothetical protein
MKTRLFVLVLAALSLAAVSCSSTEKTPNAGAKEVVFTDQKGTTDGPEVVIDDGSIKGTGETVGTTEKSSQEVVRQAKDNSRTSTMFDGYGNKTETRTFSDGSALLAVIIRTSADGSRQAYVYGPNGEVETLPENMIETALSAPAPQIAGSVGISGYRVQKSRPLTAQNNGPLRPLPSSQFPVNPQPAPPNAQTAPEPVAPQTSSEPSTQPQLAEKRPEALQRQLQN